MRKQEGFAMPGTLILLFLLFSFFIYETNMLLSDKKFYIEAEQKFILEELTDQAVSNIKQDLQQKEKNSMFSFLYEKGQASGSYIFENETVFVSLQCLTKQRREYKVNFQYDKENRKIINWVETR
ncbi:competence type IV pilus minor pilin ComGG [Bacillus gaemokensis]|uniref:Competence protein ComG n=1 Tax=Bacillus gaemokensis TaxID=574375 RepID=A0A073KFX4_9BACI|nr:competence type IV pilus minor pilin ComGG [Bacillus gaemokensis]KEK26169.1 competence protein ComG [Bacillus gaemokensis]KYG38977.1 competence protein ComG [Bacillus gaemokensis]